MGLIQVNNATLTLQDTLAALFDTPAAGTMWSLVASAARVDFQVAAERRQEIFTAIQEHLATGGGKELTQQPIGGYSEVLIGLTLNQTTFDELKTFYTSNAGESFILIDYDNNRLYPETTFNLSGIAGKEDTSGHWSVTLNLVVE